jgi:hypothetical protein
VPDGGILQLYPPDDPHTQPPVRHLRIYTPPGWLYIFTVCGYGSINYKPVDGGGEAIEGGPRFITVDCLANDAIRDRAGQPRLSRFPCRRIRSYLDRVRRLPAAHHLYTVDICAIGKWAT